MKDYLSTTCFLVVFAPLYSQVPLETTPFWVSDINAHICDVAFADIDGDGDLDMAISSEVPEGNATYLYFNTGSGFETYPSLMLPDIRSMGLAFGDVDNDGDMDLATAYTRFFNEYVRLYLNRGSELDTIPVWTGSTGATWLGWGDVDGDGDLDLAAVDIFNNASVYQNNNGTLESIPSWQAADGFGWDIAGTWFDADNDGDLDLAVGLDYRIYFNADGVLESHASWFPNTPLTNSGAGLAAGDINKDGLLDLAVGGGASNAQEPNFLHLNSPSGLETSPSWTSGDHALTWRVALGDVDGDGYLDLAAANYYGDLDVVYSNTGGTLETNPSWSSSPTDTSYGIAWADVDLDGVLTKTDTLAGNGAKKLFYLSHFPAHIFQGVMVDGAPLPLSDYCFDPVAGWISLKEAPANGSEILLKYSYSIDLDLAVGSRHPSLYRNTNAGMKEQRNTVSLERLSITTHPNPFDNFTEMILTIPYSEDVSISIYDITGRVVKRIYSGTIKAGSQQFQWKGEDSMGRQVSSGMYFIKLKSDRIDISKPIILIKEGR